MVFSHIIEWSKIRKKNECKEILTFFHFSRAIDEVLVTGGDFAAKPAGAATLEGFEKLLRVFHQMKVVSRLQVIEG